MRRQTGLHVSSEGGPVVIGDFNGLKTWSGAFSEEDHYGAACVALGNSKSISIIDFNGSSVVVWDFQGAGSAYISTTNNGFALLRYWANELSQNDVWQVYDKFSVDAQPRDSFECFFSSGLIVASWAVEEICKFKLLEGKQGVPDGELSIGDAAAYFHVSPGIYRISEHMYESDGLSFVALDFSIKV